MEKHGIAKVNQPEGRPDFPCLPALSMREKGLPVLGTRLKERRFFRTFPTALMAEQPPKRPSSTVSGGRDTQEEASSGQSTHNATNTQS